MELCRQASVEQDPEKLFQLVCRINELLEAKDQRLRAGVADRQSDRKRVFQIAYDEKLLVSRAELLKKRGYEVSSVLGNDAAKGTLDTRKRYRIFIVGHAAPNDAREDMVRWLKAHFPNTKILVVNPASSAILAGADYNVVLNGPEEWLSIIANAAG